MGLWSGCRSWYCQCPALGLPSHLPRLCYHHRLSYQGHCARVGCLITVSLSELMSSHPRALCACLACVPFSPVCRRHRPTASCVRAGGGMLPLVAASGEHGGLVGACGRARLAVAARPTTTPLSVWQHAHWPLAIDNPFTFTTLSFTATRLMHATAASSSRSTPEEAYHACRVTVPTQVDMRSMPGWHCSSAAASTVRRAVRTCPRAVRGAGGSNARSSTPHRAQHTASTYNGVWEISALGQRAVAVVRGVRVSALGVPILACAGRPLGHAAAWLAPTATPSPYLCHTQTRLRGVRLCYEGPHGLSRCLAAVVEAAGAGLAMSQLTARASGGATDGGDYWSTFARAGKRRARCLACGAVVRWNANQSPAWQRRRHVRVHCTGAPCAPGTAADGESGQSCAQARHTAAYTRRGARRSPEWVGLAWHLDRETRHGRVELHQEAAPCRGCGGHAGCFVDAVRRGRFPPQQSHVPAVRRCCAVASVWEAGASQAPRRLHIRRHVVACCWRLAALVPVRTFSTHTKASEQMLRSSTVPCPLAAPPWCGQWGQRARRRLRTWVRGGRQASVCHSPSWTPSSPPHLQPRWWFARSVEPRRAIALPAPVPAAQCRHGWHWRWGQCLYVVWKN